MGKKLVWLLFLFFLLREAGGDVPEESFKRILQAIENNEYIPQGRAMGRGIRSVLAALVTWRRVLVDRPLPDSVGDAALAVVG